MKTEDLYLNYANVINMCEGTKVKPWQGVRQPRTKELHRTDRHPDFTMSPDDYEFMVAILEDKPVFVGDKLYGKYSKVFHDVSRKLFESGEYDYSDDDYWSWNPPKSTFTLNGIELPCPQKDYSAFNLDFNSWSLVGRRNGRRYYFKSESDMHAVTEAIHKLLQDATK